MPTDWSPELEALVLGEMRVMHHAMEGERSRGDAWAAMLGVRPSAGFSQFMVHLLAAAGSQVQELAEPGDDDMASVSAGLSHGIGVSAALRRVVGPESGELLEAALRVVNIDAVVGSEISSASLRQSLDALRAAVGMSERPVLGHPHPEDQ